MAKSLSAILLGDPYDPEHQVVARELYDYLTEQAVAGGLSGTSYFRDTLTELNAVSGEVAGDLGVVLDDGTASNNGMYSTDGATWTKVADLPPGFAGYGAGEIDNSYLADMANNTIKGRTSAGAGEPEDLTAAQVRAILNVEDGATADQTGAEIKAAYEAEDDTNAFTDTEKSKLIGVSGRNRQQATPLGANSLGLVEAVTDADLRVVRGSKEDGSQVWGPIEARMSADNSMGLIWGLEGADGRVALGVTYHGDLRALGLGWNHLSDDNSRDLLWAIGDDGNRVALGVKKSGAVEYNFDDRPVYASGGDIYVVHGNSAVQLTSTGDNMAPVNIGQGRARFVSTRRRSVPIAYDIAVDDPDGEAVAYATKNTYEMVIGWGQSLMQGGANAAITTTAPYPTYAWRFEDGPIGSNTEVLGSVLEPLAEEVYETIATSFARGVLNTAQDRQMLLAGQAYGGKQIEEMWKGGATGVYEKILAQVANAAALTGGAHCRAILNIHGEADGSTSDANYADDLRTLLDDFNTDIKAALGQSDDLVMLFCQTSSNRYYKNTASADDFTTPLAQLAASEGNADMFLVGPKYWLTYNTGGNDSHIDDTSVQNLGEKYAQVYRRVVIEGKEWRPVSPQTVTVDGSDVVIDFYSPLGLALALDTTNVSDPGDYGFNLLDAGGATITGVALTGDQQVTVTLSSAPSSGWRLSYAFHNGTDGYSGPTQGARGCLRDSDPLTGLYTGDSLYNWCVAFEHTF